MKLLKCKICLGEVDLIDDKSITRKVKCHKCGFTNEHEHKETEIVVIRKRPLKNN